MALAWLLTRSKKISRAFTVDQGLRLNSAAEARQVSQWLAAWPLPHEILTLSQPPANMVMARRLRYLALANGCAARGIDTLFLAHHQDDQAETLLFRLAKGSGLDGLAGMRAIQDYDERLTLRRPLLGIPKARLVATCRHYNLPYVEDPTNENPAFARARLRAATAALSAEGLTPKRLAVTAGRLRRAADALDHYADQVAAAALRPARRGRAFDLALLAAAPEEIRLRILLRATGNRQGLRREKIEALATAIFQPRPFARRTLGGFIFTRDDAAGLLTIAPEAPRNTGTGRLPSAEA